MTNEHILIEITSDFVCPWCYVGETRLTKAIRALGVEDQVKIHWRPYELNAAMPAEGLDRREYLARKFGSPERLKEIEARMKQVGEDDDIEFKHELIKKSPNTLKAHRLVWWAETQGKATALVPAIFHAYFTEGLDIGDAAVLVKLAAKVGISEADARTFLDGTEGVDEVRAMETEAQERGIAGVPFMVIGAEKIEGADVLHVLKAAIEKALQERAAA